jgi:hypothetical protein
LYGLEREREETPSYKIERQVKRVRKTCHYNLFPSTLHYQLLLESVYGTYKGRVLLKNGWKRGCEGRRGKREKRKAQT